jgi:F-type H+-transporting ATPase subunit b
MALFEALGLNVKILIAQFINFVVLVFVLYRFGYKPMFEFLENRNKKIQKGIDDAESARKKLEDAEKRERKVLSDAKKEAQGFIQKAQETAKNVQAELEEKAHAEAEKIIETANKKIEEERRIIFQEVRKDMAGLVVEALKKVARGSIDENKSREISEKILNGESR